MSLAATTAISAPAAPPAVRVESLALVLRLRPWVFEPHAEPDHDRLFWVNKGAGRLQIDGVTRGLSGNTALFAPAGTVCGMTLAPVSAGWVVTLPRPLPISVPLPDTHVQLPLLQREEQASLTALCDEINREQQADAPCREAALVCRAGLLAVWLVRHMETHRPDTPPATSQQRLMRRFLHRLETRYTTDDSAADYAEALEVTPTHLSRICRQTAGKPTSQLIQDRAILAARQRLAFTDDRVNDIAGALGFASAAYVTRLFTARTGQSPTEFRRDSRSGAGHHGTRHRSSS